MAYRPPGAYAKFIKTAGAFSSAGANRVMAIIGTGNLMYDVVNEAVERDQDRALRVTPYDKLANEQIFEIASITSKPKVNGVLPFGTISWENGKHFTVKEGKYIVWHTDVAKLATVKKYTGTLYTNQADFETKVSHIVDTSRDFLVEDGLWKIEVVYVDETAGVYRVIDLETNEIVGEYGVSTDANKTAIPGVNLTVDSTFFDDGAGKSTIKVGDYVVLQTTAAVVPAQYEEVDSVTGTPVPNTQKELPKAGDVYYVSYTHKKPENDLEPKMFMDYDDVISEYGNYEVLASGKVLNSLSLGAEIAFTNGAGTIVCVQAKSDSDFEMKAAIDKLKRGIPGLSNINLVIPLTTSKTVGAHAMNHVIEMSGPLNNKERMTYLAATKDEKFTDGITTAKGYSNERVVYVSPGGAYKDVKDVRTGRVSERWVDGSYLAVAVACLGIKNDPAEPFTNKNIVGFNSLSGYYEESEMNAMADAGVLILKQVGPNIKIRHGITTSTSDVNSSEITLIQIKDYVIAEIRETLGDLYVGNKLRPSIVSDVESTSLSILNQFISQEVILGFGGLSVKRGKDDPRQLDVKFEIEAVYPLNYIMIEFGFSQVK